MAFLPPFVGPRAAFADLRAFLRQRDREHVIGATLAVLSTLIMVIIFFVDSQVNTAAPAQIVYVEQWSLDRTDAEIVERQKVDQAKKEERERLHRERFQRLDRSLDDLGI
jgi:hypothetical protein